MNKKYFTLALGILFLIFGIFSSSKIFLFINSSEEISGKVISLQFISGQRYILISYQVEGKQNIYKMPIGKNKSF